MLFKYTVVHIIHNCRFCNCLNALNRYFIFALVYILELQSRLLCCKKNVCVQCWMADCTEKQRSQGCI